MAKLLSAIQSWQDFKSSLEGLTKKQKGDAFEALTLAYLQLEPRYATKLKEIWPLRKVPVEVRDYLRLPVTDEGIDFVAKTVDGKYWAIQSKYKDDETATLGLGDLGTFTSLAFVTCKDKFDFALVVTTASGLSSKFPKNYGNKIGQICYRDWQELEQEFYDRLNALAENKFRPAEPRTPRPHQQRAIESAVEYFLEEGNRRGKLSHPCASGKSLTGNWIADRFDAKMVLVAVPSLSLVRQALKDYLRETFANGRTAKWIAVCSDSLKELDDGDNAVLPQDLGIKIHTDVDEIADWLRQSNGSQTYVFSTYQSGRALADASKKANVSFDLGIFDEAHRTVGKRDSLFSHLLFDENIEISRRIFMTATERYYAGGSKDQFLSMNDQDIYGDTFDVMTFKEALELDPPILCDYKIVTMGVTQEEINQLVEQNMFVRPKTGKWDKDIEARMLASAVALRKAMNKYPIKHAVSFHGSITRAHAFQSIQTNLSESLPNFGKLDVFHVTGNTPTAIRAREVERFTNAHRSLITNARCLTEGVDVPGIDCVLFADPKRSIVDVVQAVGRALRIADGKDFGYIIVPVLVDSLSDESEMGPYKVLVQIVRALGAQDQRIIEYFRSKSQGHLPKEGPLSFEDMTESVQVDTNGFIEAIELKLWSRVAKLSWRPLEEAREFVRSLDLKNVEEWTSFCKGEMPEKGTLPEDIPRVPSGVYKGAGWISWGDWFGSGFIAQKLRTYQPFEQAREFARSLDLKNVEEWTSFCKGEMPEKGTLPEDVPKTPNHVYKGNGWKDWYDWLNIGFLPCTQAREFVRGLNLKNRKEWSSFCRGKMPEKGTLPEDIPRDPSHVYKDAGWISWGDWLGSEFVAYQLRTFRPFEQAREFVRSLDLKSQSEWTSFCRGEMPEKGALPEDIPRSPQKKYEKKGWVSWGDWLGTGFISYGLRKYRPFEQARGFARNLNLIKRSEWTSFCKGEMPEKGSLPEDVPKHPDHAYKDVGWMAWADWLGTKNVHNSLKKYRTFKQARRFARSLNLETTSEWDLYCKGKMPEKGNLPDDIPADPRQKYKKTGWQSMGDWLGTGTVHGSLRTYRPFKQAKSFVKKLGLSKRSEWNSYCKGKMPEKGNLPDDIPKSPYRVYKDKGWTGWGDWLGTGFVSTHFREHRPFAQAREFVRSLDLKSKSEWTAFCTGEMSEKGTLPEDIPKDPRSRYINEGWVSWGDWLGTVVED